MMRGYVFTIRLVAWCMVLLPLAGYPASGDGRDKPARMFSEQGELNMELNADWNTILRSRNYDKPYPGRLMMQIPGNEPLSLDVELVTRGHSRKDPKLCSFPPFKIHFDAEQLKGTTLRGIKSLKMVTHCSSSKRFSSYYIKEFLIYRAYNEFTPISFRVRSVRTTYTDSVGKRKPDTRFAFFIEDVDDMAERNGLEKLEPGKFRPSMLDARTSSLFTVFQHMIGNLDWESTVGVNPSECCHNSKIIGIPDSDSPYYPVPYDFDYSGLVNAHYALPPEKLKVSKVTQRLYRGYCFHNDFTETTLETFRSKKKAILALFSDDLRLDDRHKRSALNYLERFFRLIDKPEVQEKEFNGKCRGSSRTITAEPD